jgi:adenylate cyclase
MSTHPRSPSRTRSYAAWLRRVRLWSGIALFAYVTTHLANHALGLVSFTALEAGRGWFLLLWRNPLGTVVLYGALASHITLALWSLYQRRACACPSGKPCSCFMGLTIPFLLTTHVVGTRLAHAWFDVQDSYTYVVLALWWYRPDLGYSRLLFYSWPGCMAVLACISGCAYSHGMAVWCRGSLGWLSCYHACLARIRAGLGAKWQCRPVTQHGAKRSCKRPTHRRGGSPASEQGPYYRPYGLWCGYWSHPGGACLTPTLRTASRDDPDHVSRRTEGRRPAGFSVLETSRFAQIPHASVCGGRGRCSTCRVRVVRGGAFTPQPCGRAPCP